jgi:hypothetical protein
MGSKVRVFTPLSDVSLEQLIPQDHFYRRLERALDLSFVRALVADSYAAGDRPSIDPVVFFKLQLVMFFERIHSERHLMQIASACAGIWDTTCTNRCRTTPPCGGTHPRLVPPDDADHRPAAVRAGTPEAIGNRSGAHTRR